MLNILLILLGCNVSYLLNNRIITAIEFTNTFNNTNVDWFLSGGIKNINEDKITEAEKMATKIKNFEQQNSKNSYGNKWNYIYDTSSTNTAENFVMASEHILKKNNYYDKIYIITSKFHKKRANKIAEKILHIEPLWLLGEAKLHDSDYWETIHMKNVENDVKNALNKNKF